MQDFRKNVFEYGLTFSIVLASLLLVYCVQTKDSVLVNFLNPGLTSSRTFLKQKSKIP
jgi:uncharacterized integral membrane protein